METFKHRDRAAAWTQNEKKTKAQPLRAKVLRIIISTTFLRNWIIVAFKNLFILNESICTPAQLLVGIYIIIFIHPPSITIKPDRSFVA